jgi:hypothetical protein
MSSDPYPSTDRTLPAAKLGRGVITTKFIPAGDRLGARVRASTDRACKPATYSWRHDLDSAGNHARAAKLAAAAWFVACGRVELAGANDKPGLYSWTVQAPAEIAEIAEIAPPGLDLAELQAAQLRAATERANALAERLAELPDLAGDLLAERLAGAILAARHLAASIQAPPSR